MPIFLIFPSFFLLSHCSKIPHWITSFLNSVVFPLSSVSSLSLSVSYQLPGFPSSECSLVSFSFLKDIFDRYRFLTWQLFSFSTWEMLCHFLLASVISDEKSLPLESFYPWRGSAVFLFLLLRWCCIADYYYYYLVFNLHKFDCNAYLYGFSTFILYIWGSLRWNLWARISHQIYQCFIHYPWVPFQSILFPLSFLNSDGRNIQSFCNVPWAPEVRFHIWSIFSLLSRSGHCLCSTSFLFLSSILSFLLWESSSNSKSSVI